VGSSATVRAGLGEFIDRTHADGRFKKAYGTFVSGVAQERSAGAGNAN